MVPVVQVGHTAVAHGVVAGIITLAWPTGGDRCEPVDEQAGLGWDQLVDQDALGGDLLPLLWGEDVGLPLAIRFVNRGRDRHECEDLPGGIPGACGGAAGGGVGVPRDRPERDAVRPGAVVVVRDDRLLEQPNVALRHFRTQAAAAIRRAKLDSEEASVIWALVLATESWDTLAGWVRLRLGRR